MPGSPVKLGPFVGGINTYSGPTTIDDNEAVDLLNFDIDLDGTLASRPPLLSQNAPTHGHVIGTFRDKNTGVVWIICSSNDRVYGINTASLGTSWITNAGQPGNAAVQYNDKLYIVGVPSGTTQGGYVWTGTGTATAVANMPRGNSACIYKERMFISASRNGDMTSINRVKFSNPANPETWTSTDYFDVSAGDGDDITKLYVYQGSIVVFKSDSTYYYAYETSPTKGQVQVLSSTIGCNNAYSLIEYENTLFVFHEANVYRISNWNWEHANIKVPFEYKNLFSLVPNEGTSLSIIGNRLFCRYFDNYYVLGMKTGAWARWEFQDSAYAPGEFVANPAVDLAIGKPKFFAASYRSGNNKYYIFVDDHKASTEKFNLKLVTKSYDFGPSYSFKRLFWWGADLAANAFTSFRVNPIVYAVPVTWGQIKTVPISQLGTWGRILDTSIDVTDSVNISNPTNYRTFVKLLKSLRFRQASFILESTVQNLDEPYRLFSLTAVVDNKQLVPKKVS